MAAAETDMFKKTGAGTVTTLAAPGKALSATSITVGATTNHPTDTGIVIAIRQVDSAGELVAGTYTEWSATVTSGTSFAINAVPVYGSDQVYAAGSTTQVYIPLSAYAHNELIDGILTEHNQDGTHGAVTATSVSTTDLTVTNSPTFTIGGAIYKQSRYYTYDGTDIFVDGVDQNNAANTISWTKPTGVKFVVVEVVGGGGGGAGTPSTTAGQYGCSGGGGGGAYARKKILAASLGATETVTVGAKGAGGSAGANAGSAGGNSSFGSHVSANGGNGAGAGAVQTSTIGNFSEGGNGSSTTSGEDFKIPGKGGTWGVAPRDNGNAAGGGAGGDSALGFGAYGRVANNSAVAATGYGGGGAGIGTGASQSAKAGGNGAAGIVIVHEYY